MSDWEDAPTATASEGGWEDAPEKKAVKAAPPEENAFDVLAGRGMATAAGGAKGVASLFGLPVDTIENVVNLAIAGYGTAKTAITGKPGPDVTRGSFLGSEHIASLMEKAGIRTTNPRPDDPASRMLYTGGVIGGGSLVPGGSAKAATMAAVGGATAGEALGPEWTGVGAMAPATMLEGARAAKAATSARVRENVEPFWATGAGASVGQATNNSFLQGLENLVSKFPGGSGVMKAFSEKQQIAMGDSARTGRSAEEGGRAIEKGVTGKGGFLERTKAKWLELDDAVASKIPREAETKPTNTLKVLEGLTTPTPGAEKTSGVMATPKIAEIKRAMTSDLAGEPPASTITLLDQNGKPIANVPIGGTPGKETLPYQSLRELRSKVGSMLDNALVSDIPTGELKKLYGALSRDLEAAANQAGAGKEFARQNVYYSARMDRIESVLDKVIGKGKTAEDIFKSFAPSDPDAANKVRAVMRSLEPAERQVVSEAIVNRLGRATPGRQDEFGEKFSSETFLTNWNKLSGGAKAQLFPDGRMRESVDSIAKASASIREGGKVFSNPSGTAGSFAAATVYLSPVVAASTGSAIPLAAAAGAAGSAYLGAKLLTNQKFVEWLAAAPKVKPQNMPAHLTRLGVIYNQSDEATKEELARYMQSVSIQ